MNARLAVVGSLNMDLVVRVGRLPEPGETVLGDDLRQIPGGKGANQAVSAAKLGAEVAMVGRVGDDPFGQVLRQNMAMSGVNVRHVAALPGMATGTAMIVVEAETGRNVIAVSPGANAHLTVADIDAAREAIVTADALLLQLETPLSTVLRAAELAAQAGTKVILNPAPAAVLPSELLGLVTFLVPNESEASLLADLPVRSLTDAEEAGRVLLARGVGNVLVTLGCQGVLAMTGADAVHIPARKVAAVDTTAAGDTFIGAFALAFAGGLTLPRALEFGCAAATLSTTRPGAQISMPDADEVKTFMSVLDEAGPI